jgi:hypothetical protein
MPLFSSFKKVFMKNSQSHSNTNRPSSNYSTNNNVNGVHRNGSSGKNNPFQSNDSTRLSLVNNQHYDSDEEKGKNEQIYCYTF